MTNSKSNPRKEERDWSDLLHEKKGYLKRKDEEEAAKKYLRDWEKFVKRWPSEGDPPF